MASKSRERFVTLAEKRVARAIKCIRLIGNLSNKSNYTFSDEDTRKIFTVLDQEIRRMRQRFESSTVTDNITFKL